MVRRWEVSVYNSVMSGAAARTGYLRKNKYNNY